MPGAADVAHVFRVTINVHPQPVHWRKRRCVYCRGHQFSNNCPKIEETKERKTILKEDNHCRRCLKEMVRGHRCQFFIASIVGRKITTPQSAVSRDTSISISHQ
ncbi:unnamed protein product [Caenorhabditis nigoni]